MDSLNKKLLRPYNVPATIQHHYAGAENALVNKTYQKILVFGT